MNRHAGYLIAGTLVALGALTMVDGSTSTTPTDTPRVMATADASSPATPTPPPPSTWVDAPSTPPTTHTRKPVATPPTPTAPVSTTSTSTSKPAPPPQPKPAATAKARCGEWWGVALAAGWPESALARVDAIVWRESRCRPDVINTADPNGGSRGLMQINGYWCRPSRYHPHPAGWLGEQGLVTGCDDLFDPAVNLAAGAAIYRHADRRGCGWSPWATRNTKWCS